MRRAGDVAGFRQIDGPTASCARPAAARLFCLPSQGMRPHTKRPRASDAAAARRHPISVRSRDGDVGASGCRVRQREPSDLAIHVREDLPRPLVSVAGELDLASVGLLIAMLDHVRRNLPPHTGAVVALDQVDVDVDLTAVTFADSHGLAPLLDSRTRIVAASTAVRRLLLLLSDLQLMPPSARPASRLRPGPVGTA